MPCEDPTLDELKGYLRDARAKRHSIMMGDVPEVVVDQNGERVHYNRTNLGRLEAYIRELNMKIAECEGDPSPVSYNRPLRFSW